MIAHSNFNFFHNSNKPNPYLYKKYPHKQFKKFVSHKCNLCKCFSIKKTHKFINKKRINLFRKPSNCHIIFKHHNRFEKNVDTRKMNRIPISNGRDCV